MATEYTRLVEITTIPAVATSMYANPASTKTFINSIILHNTNSVTESVEIWIVPDSTGSVGTAANANRWWADDLVANETRLVPLPKIGIILIDTNDTLQAATSNANKVTIQVSGTKET